MTTAQFVDKLKDIALNYNTLYVIMEIDIL